LTRRVLIIDDEDTLRTNLSTFLTRKGYSAQGVASAAEGIKALAERQCDILITDLCLEDGDGIQVVKQIQSWGLDATVLVMTAYGTLESAIEAFRCGVHDYILKPFSFDELERKLENITKYRQLQRENTLLRAQLHAVEPPSELVFTSNAMKELMAVLVRAAQASSNVLIYGESGTGKELVARALHRFSRNKDGLFVPLNVAAIPEGLIESNLFGHEKGSFTGAAAARPGAFRTAAGGTLFLDEIGELPWPAQAKLLRAIEEKEITPVGADVPQKVNTRVVAATHRDLEGMVRQGSFRQDLLMRLNVMPLYLPPLRERKEDIPPLTRHLVAMHCHELGRPVLPIDRTAFQALLSHDWERGNVRELSNVLERAVILSDGPTIRKEHLCLEPFRERRQRPLNLREAVIDFERGHVAWVLEGVNGDREQAAELLGVSLSTMYRHLQKLKRQREGVRKGDKF